MNALRTLPILNRPSRPTSPAPSTAQVNTTSAVGSSAPGLSQVRSRSLSRNLADKVAGMQINGSVPPPTNGLTPQHTGSGKKSPSPPTSHPPTPRNIAAPLPGPANGDIAPPTAYMDVISSRLNESVNKATAGLDFKQKKGIKKYTGWNVGEAVVKELPFPPNDAYLMRAVLRTAVRSMSIYTSRLESLLLPALTDPTFVQPLNLHVTTPNPLNPAQVYALSIAHAAWETCEVFEQTLETGKWPKFVGDTLKPTMVKLDLIVGKVVPPMMNAFRRDLVASLSRNDGLSPPSGKVVGLPSVPAPSMPPPPVPGTKESSLGKITKEPSERGQARQLAVPTCFQHFASRVDASRKVLEMIAGPCQDDGEGWITGILVPVIWKGILVSVDKDLVGTARPPSPAAVSKALQNVSEKGALPTVVHSPSLGGVTAKLTSSLSILPSRSASRPASPPRGMKYDARTLALIALEGLIKRMLGNLVPPPSGEPVTEDNLTEHLAREALHEALESLESFRIVSAAMCSAQPSSRMLSALRRVRDEVDDVNEEALDDAIEDMNSVILFTVLINQANTVLPSDIRLKSPYETYGRGVQGEYDQRVLAGFSTAEEWAKRVAVGIKGDVERVMGQIKEAGCGDGVGAEWVKCLALALDARAQVKVGSA